MDSGGGLGGIDHSSPHVNHAHPHGQLHYRVEVEGRAGGRGEESRWRA